MFTNVLEYLEETAMRFPDKEAFTDEWESYTYKELENYGQSIGSRILQENLIKSPVIVYLKKSVRVIASFMGILYSGNFYCPIDVDMPLERAKVILNITETKIVITDSEHAQTIKEMAPRSLILIYDEVIHTQKNLQLMQNIRNKAIDMDPAYVLFTSGSTGVPKGVVITHQSIIDYIEWVTETFHITSEDSFGNQAPFYFDNSILDIYCGLKNGATVFIIPKGYLTFPIKLLGYLNENKITTIFFVPSALCTLAKLHALEKIPLDTVNKVLFCGEVMPNKQLNVWRKYLPNALYANLYGPTEITDVCTYYIVDRAFEDDEPLPIGKPCQNTNIVILNEQQEESAKGEIGELCIRGRSLALGYYKNPEKSSEVFVQNPLNKEYRDLIYRTGDLVKINEKDEIIYVGRKDYQIKHMGHRIELGEIEVAAGGIQGIEVCACIYDDNKQKIVIFYKGAEIEKSILKEELKKKIPTYMIPDVKIRVAEFPYNANGKIDRKRLKEEYMCGKTQEYGRI